MDAHDALTVREAANRALVRLANDYLQAVVVLRRHPTSCGGYTLRSGLRELERAFEWHAQRCGPTDTAPTVRQHLNVADNALRSVGMRIGVVQVAQIIALSKALVRYVDECALLDGELSPPLRLCDEINTGFVLRGVPSDKRLQWLDRHFGVGDIVGEILLLPRVRMYEQLRLVHLWNLSRRSFKLESQKSGVRKAALRPAISPAHVVS